MTEGPPYVIRYTINTNAALDAARLFSARFFSRYLVALVIVLCAGIAVAVFIDRGFGVWLSLVSLLLLVTSRIPPLERWLLRVQLRSVIGGESELIIDEGGVRYRNPMTSGNVAWSALTEVRENDQTVVFLRDRLLATYAPASAFASPTQRAEAVEFARARIAAARSAR